MEEWLLNLGPPGAILATLIYLLFRLSNSRALANPGLGRIEETLGRLEAALGRMEQRLTDIWDKVKEG